MNHPLPILLHHHSLHQMHHRLQQRESPSSVLHQKHLHVFHLCSCQPIQSKLSSHFPHRFHPLRTSLHASMKSRALRLPSQPTWHPMYNQVLSGKRGLLQFLLHLHLIPQFHQGRPGPVLTNYPLSHSSL